MAFRIHLESPAPPAVVLAAIARVHGRSVPAGIMASLLVRTVTSRVRGSGFRFRFMSTGSDGDSVYELRGVVVPLSGGGVAVRARTGILTNAVGMVAVFGLMATLIAVFDPGTNHWWFPFVVIGCYLLAMKALDANVSRAQDEPRFLVECLEQAVDEATRCVAIISPTA